MKAIFVESFNGYTARSAQDDMMWTPLIDKKIFKLLTFVFGGVCVCSKNTYSLLPNVMTLDKNRTFIIAEKNGKNSLSELNQKYPNAVLVGGMTFLKQAYDLGVIDTFIITTINKNIIADEKYKNPFKNILSKPNCEITFDDIVVRVYNNVIKSR